MPSTEDRLISPKRAAEILAVTQQTVKKYIYDGRLPSATTPGGHHRVRESDVRALLKPSQPDVRREGTDAVRAPLLEVVRCLVAVIEQLCDTFEPGHGQRVADRARAVARQMGMSQQDQGQVWLAGLLHDVGKLMVDPQLLRKAGRLTVDEFRKVQQHPVHSGEILGNMRELAELTRMVRHHHERVDGRGYPDGLCGDEIPAAARIIGIAEAYDSMTSRAAYREALSPGDAMGHVLAGAGTVYDRDLVASFVRTVN
jgi:excisionase family DNA binding protein